MGFSLSWVAVKGGGPQAVRVALFLRSTGKREELPESEITAAELGNGWYLVVSQRDALELTGKKTLARLSALGDVVVCLVEEHVMCSHAAFWQQGREVWAVYHFGSQGSMNLETRGSLPDAFGAIHDRLRSEQEAAGGKKADVDCIFDVPVELAKGVVGYRHDENLPNAAEQSFEVLLRTAGAPKKPWWRKLLGF